MKPINQIHLSKPMVRQIQQEFKNKVILITGGTGSFGKKCVDLLNQFCAPEKVIIFSRDELKQHEMRVSGYNQDHLRYFIGDVRDQDRLRRAMNGVDYVIHAAALKQVPTCEYNPMEAIQTNVIGTKNIIDAAIDTGVTKVMALSTDKAVNPANLYGATKLCAEKLLLQSNAYSGEKGTRFSCVRYGNVVGSRGSVIPIFLEQKAKGHLTVTDPRMTRFWITLDQGVYFVLSCLTQMEGGEVFVPKIPSTKIVDLVDVIAPECKVDYIGIRPGEKLHEILIGEDEARHTVETEGMYVVQPVYPACHNVKWNKSKKLPDGFSFSSQNNSWWLKRDEIEVIVETHSNTSPMRRPRAVGE